MTTVREEEQYRKEYIIEVDRLYQRPTLRYYEQPGLQLGACHGSSQHRGRDGDLRSADRLQPLGECREALFTVVGDSPEALADVVKRLRTIVADAATDSIEALARTWHGSNRPDEGKPCALALVARNRSELREQLEFAGNALITEPSVRLGGSGVPDSYGRTQRHA